jgi:hypothetical protein
MSLLYKLNDMVKCVYYMRLGSNGCLMADTVLTCGHYRQTLLAV